MKTAERDAGRAIHFLPTSSAAHSNKGMLDWFWPRAKWFGIPVMVYMLHSNMSNLRLAIDYLCLMKGGDE
jgi:hypothetical protein